MERRARVGWWGLGLGAVVLAIGVGGGFLLLRREPEPASQRLIPPAIDHVDRSLPEGAVVVERQVRLTSTNLKTIGRVVFVSPLPGPETRTALADRLGWPDCGQGILRSVSCTSTGEQVVARVLTAILDDEGRDPARALLGQRAGEFAVGSVVVEVLLGTE